MTDQTIEAHKFLEQHVLVRANTLIDELLKLNEKNWDLEDKSWYEDLFLQTHAAEEDCDDEYNLEDLSLREPFEFYIVTDYFAQQLKERDALITDHFGFFIWGRETTGQHIVLDYIFQDIWQCYKNG